MEHNSKMESPTLTHFNAEEIPDHDFNTKMVKVDTTLDDLQQQIVPPKSPAAKVNIIQVFSKAQDAQQGRLWSLREILQVILV